ncbi:Protein kinase domain-containing protein [Stigmatella aurantiaca]|uniref:Protein kinase domain-containing protein n=1 Tax=Stigmatella aurantiaca TaxID=41 RepID=A0A1H8FQB7_STIAU|nr:serine/threonine-protein kinase [Stigmatella aurantiaca]SEN33755.1 Protein kinase domain-containing protein [Stigmatella aurantiaca]
MNTTLPVLEPDPASLPLGTKVGPWRVTGWRGRGTSGTVYRVQREGEAGLYALKLALHVGDERFEREASLLRRIRSAYVPVLHGQGLWQHRRGVFPYLVMQWVEGVPLYEWTASHQASSRQALRVLARVAQALEATHEAGGVHRDVKGDNILVQGPDGHPYLMDFGAGDFRGAATLTWQVLPPGTSAYRSPEAWAFQELFWRHPTARYAASPCDDLFALGITAYRMVTGEYPPPTEPEEAGAEVWAQEGPGPQPPSALNPRVSPELDALVLQLCAVSALERFKGSARQAAQALEEAAQRAGPGADRALEVRVAEVPGWAKREEGRTWEVHRASPAPPPAESVPGPSGRMWPAVLEGLWAGSVLVVVLGLLAGPLLRGWGARAEEDAREGRDGDSRDGGVTAMGDSAATSPVAFTAPMETPRLSPGFGLPIPERPFVGQRRPPCNRNGEVEIRGGCWYALRDANQPCKEDAYDWKGACYLPSFPAQRSPTSEHP